MEHMANSVSCRGSKRGRPQDQGQEAGPNQQQVVRSPPPTGPQSALALHTKREKLLGMEVGQPYSQALSPWLLPNTERRGLASSPHVGPCSSTCAMCCPKHVRPNSLDQSVLLAYTFSLWPLHTVPGTAQPHTPLPYMGTMPPLSNPTSRHPFSERCLSHSGIDLNTFGCGLFLLTLASTTLLSLLGWFPLLKLSL